MEKHLFHLFSVMSACADCGCFMCFSCALPTSQLHHVKLDFKKKKKKRGGWMIQLCSGSVMSQFTANLNGSVNDKLPDPYLSKESDRLNYARGIELVVTSDGLIYAVKHRKYNMFPLTGNRKAKCFSKKKKS